MKTIDVLGGGTLQQYGQFILSQRFNQFDYLNTRRNMIAYGTPTPPDYPLDKITSRNIVLSYGATDLFLDTQDLNLLFASLRGKLTHLTNWDIKNAVMN